jgi:hypothetical protein
MSKGVTTTARRVRFRSAHRQLGTVAEKDADRRAPLMVGIATASTAPHYLVCRQARFNSSARRALWQTESASPSNRPNRAGISIVCGPVAQRQSRGLLSISG